MGELDKLLAADEANVKNSRDGLAKLDPALPGAIEGVAGMFGAFERCLNGAAGTGEAQDKEILTQSAKHLSLTAEDLVDKLLTEALTVTAPSPTCQAYIRMEARRARAALFLLLQRSFMWGATDLLRMRITPAEGYRRLEAEAIGLLILIRDDPIIGVRWLRIVTDKDGRAFFNDTKSRVRSILQKCDLASAYDAGSGASQHVRFASAALSISWPDRHTTQLAYQEVRADDPFEWFLGTLGFLSTQVRVFHALCQAFPEVTDPLWSTSVVSFHNEIARLWKVIEQRYAQRLKEIGAIP
jgi:hypothetical protein